LLIFIRQIPFRLCLKAGPCVKDVLAAMEFFDTNHGAEMLVLVGWLFGGSVVFTMVGCAAVAGQTDGGDGGDCQVSAAAGGAIT